MDRLRAEFEALGFADVSTFIASGNVLFEATGSRASLEPKIEARLAEQLGYAVPTFVRTASVVRGRPRRSNRTETIADGDTHHVVFLRKAPTAAAKRATEALSNDQDRFEVHGNGTALAHPRRPHRFERQDLRCWPRPLGQPSTARNTKSLRKLSDMLTRAEPAKLSSMTNVMEGIRILEVAEHTFVPAASAILADWGADVVEVGRIEHSDAVRGLMNTGLAGLGGVRCTC